MILTVRHIDISGTIYGEAAGIVEACRVALPIGKTGLTGDSSQGGDGSIDANLPDGRVVRIRDINRAGRIHGNPEGIVESGRRHASINAAGETDAASEKG